MLIHLRKTAFTSTTIILDFCIKKYKSCSYILIIYILYAHYPYKLMDRYNCPFPGCTKVYKCKSNLNRHLSAIHAENKRYQCQLCGKVLSSSQNLREHGLLHSKLLPFVCKEKGCGKRFRHGSQFSAHKRIHNFTYNLLNSDELFQSNKVFVNQIGNVLLSFKEIRESSLIQSEVKLPSILSRQEFKLPEL